MALASELKDLWSHTTSVIAHHKSKLGLRVFQLDFDILCTGVSNGVGQRLPADAMHSVVKDRVQWTRVTAHNHTEVYVILHLQLIPHSRKCLLQIFRVVR